MAESKPEGPAGDWQKEKMWNFPKLREKLKNMIKSSFVKKKTEKAKANKKFQKSFSEWLLRKNDEPGVFAILRMKIESEIGIVWNFDKIWIGVLNYAVKCLLEYVKTIRKKW